MSDTHLATLEDDGRMAVILSGDRLRVELPETPSTAFQWSGDAPEGLILEQDNFEPGGVAPGAGGTRILLFRAENPGAAALILVRKRPWEPDSAGDAAFSLHIEIR